VIAVESLMWAETPPHSSLDWHNAPTTQYVITLAGELEFETQAGESFTIHPGEVLVATDTTGTGHKWRLVNDQPWQRGYVVFDAKSKINFQPDGAQEPVASCS
jgi:quercetin dioxygenase-like cupin family protein